MNKFFALSEPTREKIIELIANNGQMSASDIARKFHISAPAISQHLKVLRDANLVLVEKKAQQRIYRINSDSIFELEVWAKKMKDLWEERFDSLEKLLEKEKKKLK